MKLPRDVNQNAIQLPPDVTAVSVTTDDSITTSTELDVTLDTTTTFIRATAVDSALYLKYAATATSTDYDEYLPAGIPMDFKIPLDVTVISFIADGATAKLRLIEKA